MGFCSINLFFKLAKINNKKRNHNCSNFVTLNLKYIIKNILKYALFIFILFFCQTPNSSFNLATTNIHSLSIILTKMTKATGFYNIRQTIRHIGTRHNPYRYSHNFFYYNILTQLLCVACYLG